jgi:hypothetical protein
MGKRVAPTGVMINAYKVLVEVPEGKRPLGRRWEDNIKIELKGVRSDDME